jgi:glycosyltransferase domain-containing protein
MASSKLVDWCLASLNSEPKQSSVEDPLSRLAIVVPSYCRQGFLLRQMVYWHGSPVELFLLDGSPEPLDVRVVRAFEMHPGRHYVHNPSGFIDRLSCVVPKLNRSFAILLGDDEFHLAGGLRKAIQFLDSNLDHAGCIGQSLRFFRSGDKNVVTYGRGYQHFRYAVDQDHVDDRLSFALSQYNAATCYAVLRKEAWEKSWGDLLKTSCKDTCEVQQAIATYAVGKFATVEEVYWLRSEENISVPDSQTFKNLSFAQWWARADYASERSQLVSRLSSLIPSQNRLSPEQTKVLVENALETFYQFNLLAFPLANRLTAAKLKGAVVSLLRRCLPMSIYSRVRALLSKPDKGLIRGDLGLLSQLADPEYRKLFRHEPSMVIELTKVRNLISEFYEHQ